MFQIVEFFIRSDEELRSAIDDINKNYGNYFHKPEFDEDHFYIVKTLNIMWKVLRPYEYHSDLKLTLKKETIKTIRKATLNRVYGDRFPENKYKRLFVSHMVDLIREFIEKRAKQSNSEKILILSGHDDNITNLLSNMLDSEYMENKLLNAVKNDDDYSFVVPPLASSLLFELLREKSNKKMYIRVIYNGVDIFEGFARGVKSRGNSLLDYEEFLNLLASRVDVKYKKMNCSKTKN